ncbi:glycerophosphodiester phosphodiesterase [Cytobacillus suaedae]|nr:glycerophosphodiester phosphodiesterase [Cytobacillus suaedae]
MTNIFAHRGASITHPENTMEAFKEAQSVGADGIELDVQLSKDGVVVVIHDETVNRTTNGKGWVREYTYKQLQKFDASYKFSKKLGVCKIPSLEEVFSWATGNDMILNVELKNGLVEYEDIEEKVLELINKYDLSSRVIVSSFNHYSMVKFHQLAPEIETALIYMEGIYKPWEYAATIGAKAIHPYHPVVKEETVKSSHDLGIAVRPFTINKIELMKKLASYKCDGIITDDPKKAISVLR